MNSTLKDVNNSKNVSAGTSHGNVVENSNIENQWDEEFCDESVLEMLGEPFEIEMNESRLRTDEKYCGFDNNVGDSWIYPTNLPIRNYQFNIARVALFKNTLVVLPTGLGKTFIAAVVMYNIYRWYPSGKVIFMAPTRPLVNQQIDACRKIMGMPILDIAEMTGKQNKKSRYELWQSKRIFFATPQVVQSDINDSEQNFPFNDIKLLVFDEAHKAKGRYAYTEVVQSIAVRNPYFRVLALSATPGRRIEDVAEIVKNLFISHIEIRWENSIDVIAYTHKKNVQTVVVPFGEELTRIKNEFIDIIDPYIRNLMDNGVLSSSVNNLSRGWLIMEQKRFKEMSIRHKHPNQSTVLTNFSICISLYHALELLERHGIRVFLNFFEDNSHDSSSNGERNEKFFVALNPKLKQFLDKLRQKTGPNPFSFSDQTMTNGQIAKIPDNLDFGHPKFEITKKFLIEHFEKDEGSRAIIFCEYRESVLLIHRLLLQCRPLIKPRIFVGQGGVGNIRAVTQKQQIQIMSDFRNGLSNTLIATSVAEEGIDVGEVDLIICFDISTKNPTRFVQRIGRTGRKRQGHVIMLVTEGKEHAMVKEVLATKDKTNQKLAKSREIQQILYKTSPRIVPPEFDPKCVQTFIRIPNEDEIKENVENKSKKRKHSDITTEQSTSEKISKRRPKKSLFNQNNSLDVRNFFKKIELDNEEKEIFNVPNQKSNKTSFTSNDVSFVENLNIDFCGNDKQNEIEIEIDKHTDPEEKRNQFSSIIRKLNNFSRRLGNPTDNELIKTPMEALKSKNLSKLGKKFYLEHNFSYVKEKFELIKALEETPEEDETNEISNLKDEFSLIKNIFGGQNEIEKFLNKCENEKCHRDARNRQLKEMNDKFSGLFTGLKKRDIFDNITDFLSEKLKEIESNEEHEEITNKITLERNKNESIVYENNIQSSRNLPSINESADDNESSYLNDEFDDYTDSKYCSQWTQFKRDKIQMQSTPLRKNETNYYEKSKKISTTNQNDTSTTPSKKVNDEENFIENDLLDDDFNEMLATSSSALFEIENQNRKIIIQESDDELIENGNKNSMIPVDKPKTTVSFEKENIPENCTKIPSSSLNISSKNPEIEDFDLNDFFEPFDDEEEIFVNEKLLDLECEKNISVNMFDETKKVEGKRESLVEDNKNHELAIASLVNLSKSLQKCENEEIPHTKVLNNTNTSPKHSEAGKIKQTDTSPSVFTRKINYSKLKQLNSEFATSGVNKSTLECQKNSTLEMNQSKNCSNNEVDESVIGKVALNTKKRAIESSSESVISEESENETLKSSQKPVKKRFRSKVKRRKCLFLNNEAACSEDDGNDQEHDTFQTDSQYLLDSIVDDEFEDLSLTINTKAKYLQSIRSPKKNSAAFKLPSSQRIYPTLSQICSQPIANEEHLNTYDEGDSFIVNDEENIPEYEISEKCPLEIAEAILKAKRKNRKLQNLKNKCTRILKKFSDSSDEGG